MRRFHRYALLALSAGLLAACGKPQETNTDTPLAFAPSDTPYAYANLEPTPIAVSEQWSKHMQEYMPTVLGMYDQLLDKATKDTTPANERLVKIAKVLLGELKTHSNWDQLRQIGLKPDARVAVYGVGMVPVLRVELGDAAAFKAEIASIEQKVGEKLPVAKTGTQEYWQIGNEHVVCAVAIEGSHLVVTILPVNASDALRQALLGITRPAQSLAAAGTLQALAKQYNFTPYGEGFIDFVRITERLSKPPEGTDAEFATAVGMPAPPTPDATCKSEILEIAHKFPRFVIGAGELTAQRINISAQLEIESGLAQEIAAAFGAAPGTGTPGDGVADVSFALPILKLKDFWIKQADKIAAKPYACAQLKDINDSFAQSKLKVDVTIPPPASDLTGGRFTLDKIELAATPGGMPDFAGKLLMTSNNPGAVLALAQLAVPALKDFKLAADGKAAALPPSLVPGKIPPLFAAMSDKAIAIGVGAGEDAGLGAYLSAPIAKEAVFLRMSFSGKIYGLIGQGVGQMKAMMPAEQQAQWEQQKALFALYEKWLRRGEISFVATPNGIALREIIEQN
jgi:hypothetical protein